MRPVFNCVVICTAPSSKQAFISILVMRSMRKLPSTIWRRRYVYGFDTQTVFCLQSDAHTITKQLERQGSCKWLLYKGQY